MELTWWRSPEKTSHSTKTKPSHQRVGNKRRRRGWGREVGQVGGGRGDVIMKLIDLDRNRRCTTWQFCLWSCERPLLNKLLLCVCVCDFVPLVHYPVYQQTGEKMNENEWHCAFTRNVSLSVDFSQIHDTNFDVADRKVKSKWFRCVTTVKKILALKEEKRRKV